MAKQRPRILVAGSLVMDLICSAPRFPQSGETVIGTDFSTAPGGKGANQAVQAARLGAEVAMVGKIGRDDFGRRILDSLAASGVDTEGVRVSGNRPTAIGNIQLEVTETGTANRILVVPGANMDWTERDIAGLEARIPSADMLILQLEIPTEVDLAAARIARRHGVPVMLNSAPSAPVPEELLDGLTYISPNEHEAFDLTGVRVTDLATAREAAERLRARGVRNVIITLGSRGAVFFDGERFLHGPCVDYAPTVDPTAAGDSFVGAFCTAVCLGAEPEEALTFANHTAAITVSRMGAQPSLPSLAEAAAFLEKNGRDVSRYTEG